MSLFAQVGWWPCRWQEHVDNVQIAPRNTDPAEHRSARARDAIPGAGRASAVDSKRGENIHRIAAAARRTSYSHSAL